jgi:cyclophilin family peptidyl-prolyl cis-trans isomerase
MNQPATQATGLAFPGVLPKSDTDVSVRIKTSKGDIVVKLLPDEGPNAASNFVYLIKQKFYDGLTFHRVVPTFVIQGGDPQGTGMGGPGYKFNDDPVPTTSSQVTGDFATGQTTYTQGTLAMANAGPNTNGSQFFIMIDNQPLPPNYSVFGKVTSGQDVVSQIAQGDVMQSVTIEK